MAKLGRERRRAVLEARRSAGGHVLLATAGARVTGGAAGGPGARP